MGLDGIHLRAQWELVEEITKPLSIIYRQFWLTREVIDKRSLANVLPIYRKGQKEDPGKYKSVSLTWMLGKNHKADYFAKVHSLLDKKLARQPDPETGSEWCCIQLAPGH